MSAQSLPGFGLPDENHKNTILVSSGVTTGLAFVIVCFRLYVRSQIIRSVGGDDYWIVASLVCTNYYAHLFECVEINDCCQVLSILGFAIIIPEVKYGAGRHAFYIIQDMGSEGLIIGLKLNFITQFSYVFALAAAKVSIGLFLLRLVGTRIYKVIVWSLLVFLGLYTFGGSAALMGSCRPFAANFDRTIPGSSCYAPKTLQSLAYFNSGKSRNKQCGYDSVLIGDMQLVELLPT